MPDLRTRLAEVLYQADIFVRPDLQHLKDLLLDDLVRVVEEHEGRCEDHPGQPRFCGECQPTPSREALNGIVSHIVAMVQGDKMDASVWTTTVDRLVAWATGESKRCKECGQQVPNEAKS